MQAVEWKSAARADLWAIVDFISDDNLEAAQILKDDIEATAGNIPQHPHMYRLGRVSGTREIVIRKNYILVYAETPTHIVIVRVLHAARAYPCKVSHNSPHGEL